MGSGLYADLKDAIQAVLPVSGETFVVYLGLVLYLATCLLFRRPLTWGVALLPGLAFTVAVEGFDIWTAWGVDGFAALDRDGMADVLGRHFGDVVKVMAAPILVWLTALLVGRRGRR